MGGVFSKKKAPVPSSTQKYMTALSDTKYEKPPTPTQAKVRLGKKPQAFTFEESKKDVCDIFTELENNNISLTKKLRDTIINATPADKTNIANALQDIANYIKKILTDLPDVQIRQDGLILNHQINFGGIVKYISKDKTSEPIMAIELAGSIIDATAVANNPKNFVEALIFLHKNNITLPISCLKPLADNSANAVTIKFALQSAYAETPPSEEEIILKIIKAGKHAQHVANEYIQESLKAKPDPDNQQARLSLRQSSSR